MNPLRFVHLHPHSEYSVVDSNVRLDDAIKAAVKDGMGALALVDLAGVFRLVCLYKGVRGKGVKPIVGANVWITDRDKCDKPARLLLPVCDKQGCLSLRQLPTRAWLSNQHRGRAEIAPEWLDEPGIENAPLTTDSLAPPDATAGDTGMTLTSGNSVLTRKLATNWSRVSPGTFYVELQRAGYAGTEVYIRRTMKPVSAMQLLVAATHPVQFMTSDDLTAHEARTCIAEGELLTNPRRARRFTTEQHSKTQDETCALSADIPSVLTNSVRVVQRCNLKLELGRPKLLLFPTPDGVSLNDYLTQLAKEGLEKRMEALFPDEAVRESKRAEYYAHLEFKTDTIARVGFPGYFLIVAGFINWVKSNSVPVGLGRGSGAGPLVVHALGTIDPDPFKYNLLSECFLNPEYVSMPGSDTDFCQHGRDRIIQYAREKYNRDAISQIATFGTMAARATVHDMGRILNLGYSFIDDVAKLIPSKPDKFVTLGEVRKEEPLPAEREASEKEVKQLLELAQHIEGMTCNTGMCADGVLIALGKLADFCPFYMQGGEDTGVVGQYDKDDVEVVGLIKFDFLGLIVPTIPDWVGRYIRILDPFKANWNCSHTPLTDKKVSGILKTANTIAVSQLESRGMQDTLKDAESDRFEDTIALVALYRPGPVDLVPNSCARKHDREKMEYPDSRVEPVLKETYGVMVYQEQVMQMAQIAGGYLLGGANLPRRTMGKKKAEEMVEHRALSRVGVAKDGLPIGKADGIFDLMERFMSYGFNKSHAVMYALLAYYTAWLEAYRPTEFMTANMLLTMGDIDKVKILYDDARGKNGLTVLLPDANVSQHRFAPTNTKTICYNPGGMKGDGQGVIEGILWIREDGPFRDLLDFCERVDRRQINHRAIEALARAGVFNNLNVNHA